MDIVAIRVVVVGLVLSTPISTIAEKYVDDHITDKKVTPEKSVDDNQPLNTDVNHSANDLFPGIPLVSSSLTGPHPSSTTGGGAVLPHRIPI